MSQNKILKINIYISFEKFEILFPKWFITNARFIKKIFISWRSGTTFSFVGKVKMFINISLFYL